MNDSARCPGCFRLPSSIRRDGQTDECSLPQNANTRRCVWRKEAAQSLPPTQTPTPTPREHENFERIAELEKQLAEAEQRVAQHRQAADQSRQEVEIHKLAAGQLQQKVEVHRQTADQLRQEVEIHRQTAAQLRQEAETHKQTAAQSHQEAETHKQAADQLRQEVETHKQAADQLRLYAQQVAKNAAVQHTALEEKIGGLEQMLSARAAELAQLSGKHADIAAHKDALKATLNKTEATLQDLTRNLEQRVVTTLRRRQWRTAMLGGVAGMAVAGVIAGVIVSRHSHSDQSARGSMARIDACLRESKWPCVLAEAASVLANDRANTLAALAQQEAQVGIAQQTEKAAASRARKPDVVSNTPAPTIPAPACPEPPKVTCPKPPPAPPQQTVSDDAIRVAIAHDRAALSNSLMSNARSALDRKQYDTAVDLASAARQYDQSDSSIEVFIGKATLARQKVMSDLTVNAEQGNACK